MGKKKKRTETESEVEKPENDKTGDEIHLTNGDSHKKKKKKKEEATNETRKEENKPKQVPTVSIAVPASIIDNTQSFELATRVSLSLLHSFYLFF